MTMTMTMTIRVLLSITATFFVLSGWVSPLLSVPSRQKWSYDRGHIQDTTRTTSSTTTLINSLPQLDRRSSTFEGQHDNNDNDEEHDSSTTATTNIVLVCGFESFNKALYVNAAKALAGNTNVTVFADNEIRATATTSPVETNPALIKAVTNADVFIGSLIFDYDDVMAVEKLLSHVTGPKLLFECATELMSYNEVGTFNMKPSGDGEQATGPPPAVKAILSQFSSGREEDRVGGYVKLLKFGPDLLKFVPGEKVSNR